ncbi:MAG: DNA polymerase/3'-5' exonuclease PolX [Chitinophagaceae bacterium]|nr:DNA polymerase/3'-5' exonuclease PolX [Chitinophagaceae bacterium]
MDNNAIADNFSMLARLIDIHGDNSFKSKTYAAAAFTIEKLTVQLANTPREKLFSIKGIGESTGKKVVELLETGKLEILDEYIKNTPPGVIEMLNIKGLGPKKINTIWKVMEIDSLGELLYACNENRLTRFKGFGETTQKNIPQGIEFYFSNQGYFLYAELEEIFPQVENYLKRIFTSEKVHITGKYRRQELVIEELEFVVLESNAVIKPKFQTAQPPELIHETENSIQYKLKNGLKLHLYTGGNNMAAELFRTTGNSDFLTAFTEAFPDLSFNSLKGESDKAVFEILDMPFIPPCLREEKAIIDKAQKGQLPALIQPEDIRSVIHSHSNWSDGANSIGEMAEECIRKGLEYLVISDHSKTAAYANGLKEDRIAEQHKYIDVINNKLSPFKVFKSIESDILNDGSLDYSENVLKTFDLVIASVHSNLGMTEEKANQRLLKAIENPYTRILGHMTGRLLLSRNGYPVNHKLIIDACAANNVVVEINAHPRRLDMDWRWVDYALQKGLLLSINPDAHSTDGFHDVKYGVLAAQKGGLTKEHNLSSFSLQQFTKWLKSK